MSGRQVADVRQVRVGDALAVAETQPLDLPGRQDRRELLVGHRDQRVPDRLVVGIRGRHDYDAPV